jgi:hypothetical protein
MLNLSLMWQDAINLEAQATSDREEKCHGQLLRCKIDGTLPKPEHLKSDPDMKVYCDKDWFKGLIAEQSNAGSAL